MGIPLHPVNYLNRLPSKNALSARHIAITTLHQCDSADRTLDYWLERSSAQIEALNRPDRALVHALVYGVLRWQGRLDWIIDQLATRPGKKIDALVRTVLRMALFQIIYMDRIPPSAAVNTAVEWAKKNHRSWATGFVNSLLRRAINQVDKIAWPDEKKDPVASIAVQHAFPHWLIRRWVDQCGVKETLRRCQASNTIPPLTLRVNTLKTTRPAFMTDLDPLAEQITRCRYTPEGISFTSPAKPVSHWPMFPHGTFQIQDEAAQLIAHLLSPRPGQRIWDACAGLGTKTAHIAQLMHNDGYILATDNSDAKLARLNEEMKRLSVTVVETHGMDVAKGTPPHSNFDRILVDAPCSGLGVLQKNPDAKWRTRPDDLIQNGRRQLMLLEQVTGRLAPGGHLLYAVCSTEPEENEAVIDLFLQKHQEFVIHIPELDHIENLSDLLTTDGFFKTSPHRDHMDGFFAAALKKQL